MRFLRRSLVGLFLMSLTLAILGWAGNTMYTAVSDRMNAEPRSFPQRERVTTVNVVAVEGQTIAPELVVFGELRAQRSLDLRTTVGGTVVEMSDSFVEGGRVAAGELLVRIDPAEAEDALARAQANLADAQAEVRDADRALILARDELAAAEAQAALREQALARQQDLQTRGIGTTPELEAAELAVSSAQQSILSRRQAVAQAEARVDQSGTNLARTEISLAEAQRTLDRTEIWADFSGQLAGVDLTPGDRVTANEGLGRLIDPDALEVAFRLSTSQYLTLLDEDGALISAPLTVSLDIEGVDLAAPGVITRESALVDDGQTGRLIFASLDSATGFRPGDFVTVRVQEPEIDNIARLPATALGADNTVLVLGREDRLEVAPVRLIRRQANDVLVSAPALEGRLVVAERSPLLGAGLKVNPIGEAAPEAAPEPEFIVLEPERRARLIAAVEGNAYIPADAKQRILAQLNQDEVPVATVERLESRMGG